MSDITMHCAVWIQIFSVHETLFFSRFSWNLSVFINVHLGESSPPRQKQKPMCRVCVIIWCSHTRFTSQNRNCETEIVHYRRIYWWQYCFAFDISCLIVTKRSIFSFTLFSCVCVCIFFRSGGQGRFLPEVINAIRSFSVVQHLDLLIHTHQMSIEITFRVAQTHSGIQDTFHRLRYIWLIAKCAISRQ